MDRIKQYFELHKGFRDGMRKLQEKKAGKMADLERYKGSAGYTDDVAKVEEEHREAVKILQADYRERFNELICSMRGRLDSMTMEAPSEEELRLLSVLKMREHLTAQELVMASRSVKTHAGLGVLEELKKKNSLVGVALNKGKTISIEEAENVLNELSKAANTLCSLPLVDNRQGYLKDPKYDRDALQDHNRTAFFSADVDYSNQRDCMVGCCGGVSCYGAFEEIVNG